MKRRLVYFVIGLLVGMVGGYFYLRHRSAPPPVVAPTSPAPTTETQPWPEVAIQEGKTIDFSSGKPEIRDTPEDRAALEKAKAEMDEATKDVVFEPTKKTVEGEPTPPTAAKPPESDTPR